MGQTWCAVSAEFTLEQLPQGHGLPLSVLLVRQEHTFAVQELGIGGPTTKGKQPKSCLYNLKVNECFFFAAYDAASS
jgi:hypothetical protein